MSSRALAPRRLNHTQVKGMQSTALRAGNRLAQCANINSTLLGLDDYIFDVVGLPTMFSRAASHEEWTIESRIRDQPAARTTI